MFVMDEPAGFLLKHSWARWCARCRTLSIHAFSRRNYYLKRYWYLVSKFIVWNLSRRCVKGETSEEFDGNYVKRSLFKVGIDTSFFSQISRRRPISEALLDTMMRSALGGYFF